MEQPNYYTITPAFVRYDSDLLKKPKSILLYGEITALSNQKGYCWAGNSYFAERLKVSKRMIQDYLDILVKKKYVARKLIYKKNSKQVEKRILSIASRPGEIDFTGGDEADCMTPGEADFTDNITSINNTRVNNSSSSAFDLLRKIEVRLNGITTPVFLDYINRLGDDLVKYAIESMAPIGNPSFNYLDSILRRYEKQGIKTVEQAKKSDEAFKKQQQEKYEQKRNYSRHPKSNQIGWRKHKESDYETEEEALRKLRGDYYGD